MSSCVYKVVFNKSASELNDDYERLSDIEKERIAELGADSYFDYEDGDNYVCFLITTPLEIEKYFEILSNNFIEHKSINLSKDILNKKYDIVDDISEKVNPLNSIKCSFFIEDINYWISENLDIDLVLDRISEVGMDNLSQIEKDFLKNFKV